LTLMRVRIYVRWRVVVLYAVRGIISVTLFTPWHALRRSDIVA
jgi:hypothetical protein